MKEVLSLSFSPENIFPTILLLLAMVYWVVFLLGFLDLSFLDFDAGGKDLGDMGDMDHDIGKGHSGHGAEIGTKDFGASLSDFLNLTHVPFMIVFSFFALFYWAISLLGNHYFAGGVGIMIALVLVGGLVLSVMLAKAVTQPLRGVFKRLNDTEQVIDFRGQICVLEVAVEGKRLGQAEITIGTKHMLINVRSMDGSRIPRGKKCVIVDVEPSDEPIYLVQDLNDEETSS